MRPSSRPQSISSCGSLHQRAQSCIWHSRVVHALVIYSCVLIPAARSYMMLILIPCSLAVHGQGLVAWATSTTRLFGSGLIGRPFLASTALTAAASTRRWPAGATCRPPHCLNAAINPSPGMCSSVWIQRKASASAKDTIQIRTAADASKMISHAASCSIPCESRILINLPQG